MHLAERRGGTQGRDARCQLNLPWLVPCTPCKSAPRSPLPLPCPPAPTRPQSYGTASYAAPELLAQGKLTKAADVYSLGIISERLV